MDTTTLLIIVGALLIVVLVGYALYPNKFRAWIKHNGVEAGVEGESHPAPQPTAATPPPAAPGMKVSDIKSTGGGATIGTTAGVPMEVERVTAKGDVKITHSDRDHAPKA